MIKVNEVRCDNWLMGWIDKKPVKVDWLVIKHLSDGNIQSVHDPKPVYEPIPLSSEILKKCGFEINQDGVLFEIIVKDKKISMINASTHFITAIAGPFGMIHAPALNYIHQLQNLFFAITGEELSIKL